MRFAPFYLTWFDPPLVSVGPKSERGSVTAELVLALPTVILLIVLAIGALSIQLHRIELASLAGDIAKAVARQEPERVVQDLIARLSGEIGFELLENEGSVCVRLSESIQLPIAEFELMTVEESACALTLSR
jgi:hypothetical protein